MVNDKTCSECGAKTVRYKFTLNKCLVSALKKMWYAGNRMQTPVKATRIGLTHYQYGNFTKLRYWGLIEESFDLIGQRITGCWNVTQCGVDFLENGVGVSRLVTTYRGRVVDADGPIVYVDDEDLPTTYEQANSYAANAEAHERTKG